MRKFKVGDNVIMDTPHFSKYPKGSRYVVRAIQFDPNPQIRVDDIGDWWCESHFTSATPVMDMSKLAQCSQPVPKGVGTRWVQVSDNRSLVPGAEKSWPCGHAYDYSTQPTNPGLRTYPLHNWPADATGLVYDPIRLGEMGYYVCKGPVYGIRGTLFGSSWETKEMSSFIDAWISCAQHAKGGGK